MYEGNSFQCDKVSSLSDLRCWLSFGGEFSLFLHHSRRDGVYCFKIEYSQKRASLDRSWTVSESHRDWSVARDRKETRS